MAKTKESTNSKPYLEHSWYFVWKNESEDCPIFAMWSGDCFEDPDGWLIRSKEIKEVRGPIDFYSLPLVSAAVDANPRTNVMEMRRWKR